MRTLDDRLSDAPAPVDHRRMAQSCLDLRLWRTDWERAMLKGLLRRDELTRTQWRRLDRIFERGCSR